jgi:hypothetical protein
MSNPLRSRICASHPTRRRITNVALAKFVSQVSNRSSVPGGSKSRQGRNNSAQTGRSAQREVNSSFPRYEFIEKIGQNSCGIGVLRF